MLAYSYRRAYDLSQIKLQSMKSEETKILLQKHITDSSYTVFTFVLLRDEGMTLKAMIVSGSVYQNRL